MKGQQQRILTRQAAGQSPCHAASAAPPSPPCMHPLSAYAYNNPTSVVWYATIFLLGLTHSTPPKVTAHGLLIQSYLLLA